MYEMLLSFYLSCPERFKDKIFNVGLPIFLGTPLTESVHSLAHSRALCLYSKVYRFMGYIMLSLNRGKLFSPV